MKKTFYTLITILLVALIGQAMWSVRQRIIISNQNSSKTTKATSLRANNTIDQILAEAERRQPQTGAAQVRKQVIHGEEILEAEAPGQPMRFRELRDMRPARMGREEYEEYEREHKKGRYTSGRRTSKLGAQNGPITFGPINPQPSERRLTRAGRSFNGDIRNLPVKKPVQRERPELEGPAPIFRLIERGAPETASSGNAPMKAPNAPLAPAPPAILGFEGLDRENWGAGSPPDMNGDVGPTYYIQTVNTSVGIFNKTTGAQVAAFTFDTLMSQGNFGNLCDTNNFGDPVVLYDTFEDRWVLTDFAFILDGGGNAIAPSYQCFAVSKTGDPVSGGWNFYSIELTDGLNDYPKLGVWTDGIYMSANMFGFGAGGTFKSVRTWAFNKAQMYAGSPIAQVITFDIGSGDFTLVPSNARLQTGTPPPGRPNLFVSTWNFTNALTVYKFHVDWDSIGNSTFNGPDKPIAATSWPNATVANAPQPGTATLLDVLQIRAMVQNQYTNYSGVESLWATHTVRRANTTGFAAPRWYQVNVTGGTVAANLPQAATWDPDAANVLHRFMPSLALDRAGNLAMGYSTSNNTAPNFPSIAYAGRLAADAINTFSQTEQQLFAGTASQTGSSRWGDYSSMTLDPDGCTFWYTNEYANPVSQTFDKRWKTRINSFSYASIVGACTPFGAGGTVSGTVTVTPGGAPISGATVNLGARSATTNGSGFYQFLNIPAGTYPGMSASFPGYNTATASNIVVTDGNTTTQNFMLTVAPTSACPTDTTQADFQMGVGTTIDLITNPGDVTLPSLNLDQLNTAGTTTGTGFGTPAWTGQTFIPAVTGTLVKADVQLFCNGCGATPPNLTLSVRSTSGGLPTGADLATVTIPGSTFASGSTVTYTATFGSPAMLTSGTQYALILRPVSAPAGTGYFWIRSSPSTYANGQRVLSANSGGTWTADSTRDYNFKTYMVGPYSPSGNLVSSTKDANPAVGFGPLWTTLSWTATTPANTSVKFQVAGSNNEFGPFNFVGPDNTAGTFFTTTGALLSQFNGLRYLKYKTYLATTDSTVTPTLQDVTVCYNNIMLPTATVTGNTTICSGTSTNVTVTVSNGTAPYTVKLSDGSMQMGNGPVFSFPVSPGSTTAYTLAAGSVDANGFAITSSDSATVNVNPTPATPTITPSGPTTFCQGGSVTLTSSSAAGNQWYLNGNPIGGATNQQYVATASGNYTVIVTASGCPSAPSLVTAVTVNPTPATPTITPGGPTTFCQGGSVTLTSSSAAGNQWYLNGNPIGGATNQQYVATASGNYTVIVTASGCPSAPSATTAVTVNPTPATPTITPGGPTTFCQGGSVTLTSSSATGNQWYQNGNPIGGATNQTYVATASGSYTVIVTANSCPSAPSSATSVTVNPIPATPTISAGGPTSFCPGGSVTLTSSSASGNQWYLNGNPIGGATNQNYIATGSGNYTVIVTLSGCSSAASASTTVTAQDTQAPMLSECPANQSLFSPTGNPIVVNYMLPTATDNCGSATVMCSPTSGSPFSVGTTTVTCTANDASPDSPPATCAFTVTVTQFVPAPTMSLTDPLNCNGPGDLVNGSFAVANTTAAPQTGTVTVALPTAPFAVLGLPNTCVANFGTCTVTATQVSWSGTIPANQTLSVSYQAQVADGAVTGQSACATTTAVFGGTGSVQACLTINCPAVGVGALPTGLNQVSDQKPGSVLLYPVYTSDAANASSQNARLNITNTHPSRSANVHLFFVDGSNCSVADSYICLTANQTASVLASDIDPGTTGYLVAIATDRSGCPINFNYLIGDEFVKFSTGHAANLGAEAVAAIAGGLPACNAETATTATLSFDGVSYNPLPRVLALSNLQSRADGNDTLLIVDRIGGSLISGAATINGLFGLLYDDAEKGVSFQIAATQCQYRASLNNDLRTTPRYESIITGGRTGWMRLWGTTNVPIIGAQINRNANAASNSGAFNQGHNLHKLTLTSGSYTIPVFPPLC